MPAEPLAEQSISVFLDSLGAKTPTPGGGGATALVGAIAAALARMVVAHSVGKASLEAHRPALEEALGALEAARDILLRLGEEDAEAYALVNALWKLSKDDPRRVEGLPDAVRLATRVPLSIIATAADLLRLLERLSGMTNRHLRSDLAIAAVLAEAVARAARWTVEANLPLLSKGESEKAAGDADGMLGDIVERAKRVEAACG